MKKIVAVIVLILAGFVTVNSQVGDLKKQTYFRIGYSIPTWKYFGQGDKSDWLGAKRVGGVFEVGNIFMLNSLKLSPGMRLGINVDYLSIDFHRFYSNETNSGSENLFFVGSKIGPSFSYSPVKRLVFDAYVKFNPVWVAGEVIDVPEGNGEDHFYLGYLGVKYSFGLNIRYAILMTGIEINPGFVRMKLFDEENKKFVDIYRSNVNDNSNRTPVPGVNFTVGLSF